MQLVVSGMGTAEWRMKIAVAQGALQGLLEDAALAEGEKVANDLKDAAPVGKTESQTAIPGDASGRLKDSFSTEEGIPSGDPGAAISVVTSQPTKLRFVREGRGVVLPKVKQALFWEGLDHPVKRAGPSAANDFVTPVLEDEASGAEEALQLVIDELETILGG